MDIMEENVQRQNQAMEQLEDRIVGRIEHSFNAYTPVTLQYMNDMIVKAAKLEVSRKLAKKKVRKVKKSKRRRSTGIKLNIL